MKDDKFNNDPSSINPIEFHAEKYKGYIEDMEITSEQEGELLKILWDIMSTMVDIGFGEHSVQAVLNSLVKDAIPELTDTPQQKHRLKNQCQDTFKQSNVKEDDYA